MSDTPRPIYIVVSGCNLLELIKKVNYVITDDYVPIGGVAVTVESGTLISTGIADFAQNSTVYNYVQAMCDRTWLMMYAPYTAAVLRHAQDDQETTSHGYQETVEEAV